MATKLKFKHLVVTGALLLLATNSLFAADLPQATSISMKVQPLLVASAPGKSVSLDVNVSGVSGLGVQTPVSVTGAPDGTTVQVTAVTDQRATVSVAFPSSAARGKYQLSVEVGSPMLVGQNVELTIGE